MTLLGSFFHLNVLLLLLKLKLSVQGQYFCKGDIVSVVDVEGGVYYAQLKGFLTDQYCEKSGVITWLLPTTESPPPEQVGVFCYFLSS